MKYIIEGVLKHIYKSFNNLWLVDKFWVGFSVLVGNL